MNKLLWILIPAVCLGSDVQWSRLRGTVKSINLSTSQLTIENPEGDLLSLTVNGDVHIAESKTDSQLGLKDLHLDEKVTLIYIPEAPKPKEEPPFPGPETDEQPK